MSSDGSPPLSGRLARNSIWNLVGLGLPLVVAVVAIPRLVELLGTERFGLLAIGWAFIGYFSLFDLGLGRALTKLVAERIATGDADDLPELIGTGLVLLTALGVLASVAVLVAVPMLIESVLVVPISLRNEAKVGFSLLAYGLPVVMLSAALVGVLEGQQRFRTINLVRIPAGVLTYLGPLLAVLAVPGLVSATLALVIVRIVSAVVYAWCARGMLPRGGALLNRALIRPLLTFGGWVTVSNVVGPLMVYFDRFVIGAQLSLSAVAYYATPYEVITRAFILPAAVTAVIFPEMTMASVADPGRLDRLFRRTVEVVLALMTVPLALVVLFAPEGLELWLGREWAEQSTAVLRWLAVGVLISSVARVPFTLIQGAGRPDLTAKLHVAELPAYLLGLAVLLGAFGITGAAAAWTLRNLIDMALLFWLGVRVAPAISGATRRAVVATMGATLLLGVAVIPVDSVWKIGYAGLLVALGALLALRAGRLLPRIVPG